MEAWEAFLYLGDAEALSTLAERGGASADRHTLKAAAAVAAGQTSSALGALGASALRSHAPHEPSSDVPQRADADAQLVAAVARLREFQRRAYTGPPNVSRAADGPEDPRSADQLAATKRAVLEEHTDASQLPAPSFLDGEDVAPTARSHLPLLLAAIRTFDAQTRGEEDAQQPGDGRRFPCSAHAWKARCAWSLQGVLRGRSPTAQRQARAGLDAALAAVTDAGVDGCAAERPTLTALLWLEDAVIRRFYYDLDGARRSVNAAADALGVVVRLNGALGVRTRYQQKPTAVMVATLHRTTATPRDCADLSSSTAGASLPLNEPSDDDVALGEVRVVREAERVGGDEGEAATQTPLRQIDRLLMLAHAELAAATPAGGEEGGLADESTLPFLTAVLSALPQGNSAPESPVLPSAYVRALYLRSVAQQKRTRLMSRSLSQMEALVKYLSGTESGADDAEATAVASRTAAARVVALEASGGLALWQLQREYAMMLGRAGLVRSAADVLEAQGLWDELIECHRLMGNVERAKALLQRRLGETSASGGGAAAQPALLAAMGELTLELSWFERAWEVSEHRYARGRRQQAHLLVRLGRLSEALDCFEDALAINALHPNAWFDAANAAFRLGELERAARYLTTVVQLEPERAEAWNNLGSAQLQLRRTNAALYSLQHAARLQRDRASAWEALRTAALMSRSVPHMLAASDALVELRGADGVSTRVLHAALDELCRLTRERRDNSPHGEDKDEGAGADGARQAAALARQLSALLRKISAVVSTNADVWEAYAVLSALVGDAEEELESRRRQIRALDARGCRYTKDSAHFEAMAAALSSLASAARRTERTEDELSAHGQLNGFLKVTKEPFGDTDAYAQVQAAADELTACNGANGHSPSS